MERARDHENIQRTILVVDDSPDVLRFVRAVLIDGNYNVLTSCSGEDALLQSKNYEGEIDLLLSDFQMPGMNGIDLAVQLCYDRPQIQVLLMSGFAHGMLVLNEG